MPGNIAQVVNFQTGEVATGAVIIPYDDTKPQQTEGVEFMTLAITPKRITNNLKIEVVFCFSYANANDMCVALFQDDTADAIACGGWRLPNGNLMQSPVNFNHFMPAGTLLPTTFKVRAGGTQAGVFTFNGVASARQYGGALASSITITEITQFV